MSCLLFVAVRWSYFGSNPGWSLNISTNDGASWSEVYYLYTLSLDVYDIDMVAYDTTLFPHRVRVAYIWEGYPTRVDIRRFQSNNGDFMSFESWFDDTPQEKTDVALAGASAVPSAAAPVGCPTVDRGPPACPLRGEHGLG